jgi:SnoaL-like domain
MSTSTPTLVQYYERVDAGEIDAAMALVSPDVTFAIVLPGRAIRGTDRSGLVDYLSGRGDVVRRHVPQRAAVTEDAEFVYGAVVEDDRTTTGHFLASVRIDADGLIAAYQVAFDPEHALFPGV